MLTTVQKVRETVLLSALNIVLPTGDVYSDLALITKFLTTPYLTLEGEETVHLKYGLALLAPFLANYLLTWIAWFRVDKQKRLTWLACLLACYPQLKAAQVIWYLWTHPRRGMEKKRKMEREVVEMEAFCEAVPSTLVMTFLMVRTMGIYSNLEDYSLIIGEYDSSDLYLFLLAFSTSVLSSSLGLAKVLKSGPCRVVREGGALGGLVTPRFLLLTLACGFTLAGKGAAMGLVGLDWGPGCPNPNLVPGVLLALATTFLPGLLLALVSTFHTNMLSSFLRHPSLLLLPTFTSFTFASNTKLWGKQEKEVEVRFSWRATGVNLLLTSVGHVAFSVNAPRVVCGKGYKQEYTNFFQVAWFPLALLGLLFTLQFLLTSLPSPSSPLPRCLLAPCLCCCSPEEDREKDIWRTSTCTSCSPAIEVGVFRPDNPHVPFVARTNPNTGEEEVVREGQEEEGGEEVEMVGVIHKIDVVDEEKNEVRSSEVDKDKERTIEENNLKI